MCARPDLATGIQGYKLCTDTYPEHREFVICKIFLDISKLIQFRNYARSPPGKDNAVSIRNPV